MPNWREIVQHITDNVDDHFDRLLSHLHRSVDDNEDIHVSPYMGYGTPQNVFLRGRAFRHYSVTDPTENDTVWLNLLNIYRRFNSHEFPNAPIEIMLNGVTHEVNTNDEGHFRTEVVPPATKTPFLTATYTMTVDGAQNQQKGEILIPPANAQFGVISDIDDTVLHTQVTQWLKLARNTFLRNAHTRLPLPGVAAFYRALQEGGQDVATFNPIFYVSNGVWNLHDLLVDFFGVRGIPLGPLFLRDAGFSQEIFGVDPLHKINTIRHLLALYPDLPFILIGDSGEKDAAIYAQAVSEHPGRIPVVYIRDVDPHIDGSHRDERVERIAEEIAQYGTEMLLIPDTLVAAQDAIARGYLDPAALPAISRETEQDRTSPNVIEKLVAEAAES
jgi:phosphatidate phosphatase APP1